MNNEMQQKYQKHHNEVMTGTLTDMLMKSINYQANIKLANEVISEQEKQIEELENELSDNKEKLEEITKNKSLSDNSRITILENDLQTKNDIINKLNTDLVNLNRLKIENENLKVQVANSETFKSQLIRERESNNERVKVFQNTITQLENTISELNQKIENLQNPPRRKRVAKQQVNEINVLELTEMVDSSGDPVRDGGSF